MDGSCFFHAVHDQLTRLNKIAPSTSELRQQLVEFLGKILPDDPLAFHCTPNYLEHLTSNMTWADAVAVQGMARMLSTDMIIVTSSECSTKVGYLKNIITCVNNEEPIHKATIEQFPERCILLGHLSERHYISLDVKCSDSVTQVTPIAPPKQTSKNNESVADSDCQFHGESKPEDNAEVDMISSSHVFSEGDHDNKPTPACTTSNCNIPVCWSQDQYLEKVKEYPWLHARSGRLGCTTCRDVKNIHTEHSHGCHQATEWVDVKVECYGDTKTAQLMSLRKKICKHRNSSSHIASEKIISISKKKTLQDCISKQHEGQQSKSEKKFRTVYYLMKQGRPFTDMPCIVDLQMMNGLDMGRTLQSDMTASKIVTHIATEMRHKLCDNIVQSGNKFSILIDESTTVSRKSVLTVHMRSTVDSSQKAITFFLDLLELEGTTAQCIMTSLMQCLINHGFTDDVLSKDWICFACDGASVMLGNKAGVASLLLSRYPNLIIWHCSNHRLELAVGDTVEEVAGSNNFRSFFDKLYSLYHASPKNQRELEECCNSIALQCLAIGRVLNVRWVASSLRTIKAVWIQYPALYKHFSDSANDKSRSTKDKSTYEGLRARLTSNQFVSNMGIMYDALVELADVSLQLQRREMTFPAAHNLISRQIRVFSSMANGQYGPHTCEAMKAVKEANFQGVILHQGRKCDVAVQPGQFFLSLSNNLKARMFTLRPIRREDAAMDSEREYEMFLDTIKCLYPENWTSDDFINDNLTQADDKIRQLCQRFRIISQPCVSGYREFKDAEGRQVPPNLRPVITAVNTLVVSTADCERSFSCMNNIMTPTRNSLEIQTLSALLFVSIVAPPTTAFKPAGYVKSWLGKNHTSADDTKARARRTGSASTDSSYYDDVWRLL